MLKCFFVSDETFYTFNYKTREVTVVDVVVVVDDAVVVTAVTVLRS